jgi:hypothetical protein
MISGAPRLASRRRRQVLIAIGVSVLILSVLRLESTSASTRPSLAVSLSPDRTNAVRLDGSTVKGKIYVFVKNSGTPDNVDFYLDRRSRTTPPVRTETDPPFDFAGTAADGAALPYDTTNLADGSHTIRAVLRWPNGSTSTRRASFTIANRGATATPTTSLPTSTTAAPTASATAAPTTTPSPAPVQTDTGNPGTAPAGPTADSNGACLAGPSNAPGTADPWGRCWPGPQNTGVPAGKTLKVLNPGESVPGLTWSVDWSSWFVGKCGTVLDGLDIRGNIFLRYGNTTRNPATPCVTIKNSKVHGLVDLDAACLNSQAGNQANHCGPLVMTDSELFSPALADRAELIYDDYYVYRMNIHGTPLCNGNCVIQDSWVHDLWAERGFHMDAVSSNGTGAGNKLSVTHSYLDCGGFAGVVDPQPGLGCSTVLASFPDFDSITLHATYNYIAPALRDGLGSRHYQPPYCLNPGQGTTKPYPTINDYIAYNVFARGFTGHCGLFGAVYDWGNGDVHSKGTDSGNVWGPGNRWDDGEPMDTPNANSKFNCSGQDCLTY